MTASLLYTSMTSEITQLKEVGGEDPLVTLIVLVSLHSTGWADFQNLHINKQNERNHKVIL